MEKDPIVQQAIAAIDSGDTIILEALLAENPWLLKERLVNGEEGYFIDPYLLWYVAGNPVRQPRLADNISDVTRLIIKRSRCKGFLPAGISSTFHTTASGCSGTPFSCHKNFSGSRG
jgi:hypothetical protein